MSDSDNHVTRLTIDIVLKLAIVGVLMWWSFSIISPFILMLIWAGILAVALYPLQKKLIKFVPKSGLSASLISLFIISILVVPVVVFGNSTFDSVYELYQKAHQGGLSIPQPNESIKEWPLIGDKLYALWLELQQHTEVFIQEYKEEIGQTLKSVVGAAAGTLGTLLMLVVSLIIAAVFMSKAATLSKASSTLIHRVMAENGERTKSTIVLTIRSVATGVLGVALIQALLAGLGMIIAGIPAAGILTLVVMICAIAQLPPLLVLGPVAAYYFSVADTVPAVIFLVFAIVVSFSDAILKPIFLGRGMDIPMPVILLGAIGGMLMYGIIGLFVGAVILALSYELMLDWLNVEQEKEL